MTSPGANGRPRRSNDAFFLGCCKTIDRRSPLYLFRRRQSFDYRCAGVVGQKQRAGRVGVNVERRTRLRIPFTSEFEKTCVRYSSESFFFRFRVCVPPLLPRWRRLRISSRRDRKAAVRIARRRRMEKKTVRSIRPGKTCVPPFFSKQSAKILIKN